MCFRTLAPMDALFLLLTCDSRPLAQTSIIRCPSHSTSSHSLRTSLYTTGAPKTHNHVDAEILELLQQVNLGGNGGSAGPDVGGKKVVAGGDTFAAALNTLRASIEESR